MNFVFWSFLLMAVALVVMALELFLPSGGVLGLVAAGACVASIVVAFQSSPAFGLSMLAAAVVLLPILLVVAVQVWPLTPLGKLVIGRLPSQDDVLPPRRDLRPLIGRRGVAGSELLPGGVVQVQDETFDAVTPGVAVARGEPIEVIRVEGNRLIVQPLQRMADREGPAGAAAAPPHRDPPPRAPAVESESESETGSESGSESESDDQPVAAPQADLNAADFELPEFGPPGETER